MRVFVVDVSDWWAQPIAVYKHEHDSLKNDVLLMPWLYVMCVYVPRFFLSYAVLYTTFVHLYWH